MNKPIRTKQTLSLLITAAVIVGAVCWVAGCAKKSGREAVPEIPDTLTVISDTLSKTHDTLSKISGTLTDKRDGKTYKTVTIGKQTWMAENFNYATSSGSWCYHDNCAKYADSAKYGRLYDWATAMDEVRSSSLNPSGVQGVCPSGWHLPSRAEWDELAEFVGGTKAYSSKSSTSYHDWYDAGKYLKSQTGWNSYCEVENLDMYGFSALSGGYRNSDGNFVNADDYGYWWTATEFSGGYADVRYMLYGNDNLIEYGNGKDFGFSVRCVKDTD